MSRIMASPKVLWESKGETCEYIEPTGKAFYNASIRLLAGDYYHMEIKVKSTKQLDDMSDNVVLVNSYGIGSTKGPAAWLNISFSQNAQSKFAENGIITGAMIHDNEWHIIDIWKDKILVDGEKFANLNGEKINIGFNLFNGTNSFNNIPSCRVAYIKYYTTSESSYNFYYPAKNDSIVGIAKITQNTVAKAITTVSNAIVGAGKDYYVSTRKVIGAVIPTSSSTIKYTRDIYKPIGGANEKFEMGKSKATSDVLPLQLTPKDNQDADAWSIYGNAVNSSVPSFNSPSDINFVGDYIDSGEHAGEYKVSITATSSNSESNTIDVYLNAPMISKSSYVRLNRNGNCYYRYYPLEYLTLTGDENWADKGNGTYELTITSSLALPYICTHAVNGTGADNFGYSAHKLTFYRTGFATLEAWKGFLATQSQNGTPVKLPKDSGPSDILLENIPVLRLYRDSTTITSSTTVQPSEVSVTYTFIHLK